MTLKIFIAGTDTEVGKTYVTEKLLQIYNKAGYQTLGLKPVASGAKWKNNKLYNDDAVTLMQASSVKNISYDRINPFVFENPVAPHLAADIKGTELTLNKIKQTIEQTWMNIKADVYLVEGVGGWAVPLNSKELMANLVQALQLPVILVVGIKLGCLNHAILTAKTIIQSNVPLLGWIANCLVPETQLINENIDTLKQWITAPHLATIPFEVSAGELFYEEALFKEISPTEKSSN